MPHAFDAVLAEWEREDAHDPPHRPFAASVSALAVAAVELSQPHTGAHSLWEAAAAWTPEADPPAPSSSAAPARSERPRPSARPEDILAELAAAGLKTPTDIAQARRKFMWDNHPDRRKDLERDLANRRVAIANMLLDRALARLGRRQRGR